MRYRLALLVLVLVTGFAGGARADSGPWIDPDEQPNEAITDWVARSARAWIAVQSSRSVELDPSTLTFGTPVRALAWQPRTFDTASPTPSQTQSLSGPGLPPPQSARPTPRRVSPPRHLDALPAGADPVVEGITQAVDAWWVPVLRSGVGVGILQVSFARNVAQVDVTFSAPAAARLLADRHALVRDPNGWIGVSLPYVKPLDDAACQHVAGEVNIDDYLDYLAGRIGTSEPGRAQRPEARTPITVTVGILLALGAALWLVAFDRRIEA